MHLTLNNFYLILISLTSQKCSSGNGRFTEVRVENQSDFYGEELLAPTQPYLGDQPLSAVCDCLLNIFTSAILPTGPPLWSSG
jgi:hypothetical protein